jgi:hypothetical protein
MQALKAQFSAVGLLLVLFVTFCAPLALSPVAMAKVDILKDACDSASTSTTCKSAASKNDPITGPDGTLDRISTVVAIIAGISAVIMIILSGFRYVTSGGDTQKIASAKNTLIGAIVGLVIIVVARGIIVLVLKSIG